MLVFDEKIFSSWKYRRELFEEKAQLYWLDGQVHVLFLKSSRCKNFLTISDPLIQKLQGET